MELGGAFCCLGSFFLLERERERERELWTTFCAVLIEEWKKTFLLMMPAHQSQLLTIKVFVVLFVVFLSAAGWR
jgi:hypothetical protein